FITSNGSLAQAISKDSTSLALTALPATLVNGQAVSFTALVSNTSSGSGSIPTGLVQFAVDGVNFGSPVSLSAGTATSAATMMHAAHSTHTITATYSNGDDNFLPSNGSLAQAVSKDSTSVMLTAAPSSLVNGQAVSFTGVVSNTSSGSSS